MYSLGFGCYLKDGRLTWSQGSAKKFNLTVPQLDQLYNIMLWSHPPQLRELSLSIARDSVKLSKFPNLLAQARSLTQVTILSGAENHTLRILGLNCPCLTKLDVSHSIKINDQGLRNLLLRYHSRRRNKASTTTGNCEDEEVDDILQETNPCAEVISSIILVGTSVTWAGCDLACKLMNFGYYSASLPFINIVRVNKGELCLNGLPFDRQSLRLSTSSPLRQDDKDVIFSSANNCLLPETFKNAVMDLFTFNNENGSPSNSESLLIFLRDNAECFKMHLHLKMEASNVTSLVLPWYTFTWRLDSLVDLDTLGTFFPSLKFLKGRIKGRWNQIDEPLLPSLQAAYVWSLNSATALSMLENIPGLKFLEFNNTRTLNVHNFNWELTDISLEKSLQQNKSLAKNLETFTIRPTGLTVNALKYLIKTCPNIRRIGDLESWAVTPEQITEFNSYLDSAGSQCVLTIMNFPPATTEENQQWSF